MSERLGAGRSSLLTVAIVPARMQEQKWNYGTAREIQPSGFQVQGEREQTRAGCNSQSSINLST